MKRVVKWLLIFIAALAVGATVLVYNPGLVKGPLERYLSDVAGYSISVEGQLKIRPGRLTEITATGIRVPGPEWAKRPDLIVIGYLNLTLRTSSLFKNIIVLDSLRVDKAQLNLETSTEGVGNWIRANTPDTRTNKNERDSVVVFDNIELNDIRLRVLSARKQTEHLLHLATLDQKQLPDGMLNISLLGDFNNEAITFEGNVGPYKNLLQGRDISYSGSGNFGSLEISSSGLIDDLLTPRYPQFDLELQGPNIDRITAMFGADDLGSGVLSLQARGANINGQYEAGISGSIGDISLDVSARASDVLELNELDLTLAANGPNLGAFMRTLGIENWPDKPFDIKGDVDRVGSTLDISKLTLNIGDSELVLDALLSNFPSLDSSRVRLSVVGNDASQFRELLGIHGIATGPFEIQGRLDVSPREVELLRFEIRTSIGHLTVSGTLGPGPAYGGSKLHVELDGNNAHTLMSMFNIDVMPEDAFNLDAQIETTDSGLLLERFVVETAGNERLELGGYLSYNPGSRDTAVDLTLNGQHLQRVLQIFIPSVEVPDLPYDLSGHILVAAEDVELRDVKAGFADIELDLAGSVSLLDHLVGTKLNFRLDGKDLSTLNMIPGLSSSLAVFVPGQSYDAAGQFHITRSGWDIDNIKGRIGDTDIVIDGQISKQPDWSGLNVDFSFRGPDLHTFIINRNAPDLSLGAFKSNGRLELGRDALSIRNFSFETNKASGNVNLEFGWPISSTVDADFQINLWGKDIRSLLPALGVFEPASVAYRINAAGHQRDEFISFKQFDAVIGDLQVSLEGKVQENVKIALAAQAVDLSTLGILNGRPLPALALDLKADFSGGANHFSFHDISGNLGETDFSGNIEISLAEPRPIIDLTVKSRLLDLRPFLSQFDKDDEKSEALRQERLIPAIRLPLEVLKTADLNIAFSADEIRRDNDSLKNLVLEADVFNGKLNVPIMSVNGSRQGRYRSSLTIDPTDAGKADVRIDITVENMLLNLFDHPQHTLSALPLYDLEFHGQAKGGDLRELAASLNGSLTMESGGGSLGDVNLGMLDVFLIDEIFGLIMPKSDKDDTLEVNCYASSFKITDGLVRTDPAIAYSTNKLILIARGTLNLKTERLSFNFNATPARALKVSASELINPYIRIGGTLADPDVGLDPGKTLLHGGAAVGTAGISILAKGLLDRMSTATPLCEQMLEQARQDQQ